MNAELGLSGTGKVVRQEQGLIVEGVWCTKHAAKGTTQATLQATLQQAAWLQAKCVS